MKIAVLSSHTPSLFWFRMDMMAEFIARGHEVMAIGNEDAEKWHASFDERNIRYIQANISRNGTNPFDDLKTLRSLKKILAEEKPDKIFAYQAKTVIYGGLAAKKLGIAEVYPLIAGVGSVFMSDGIKAKIIRAILRFEYKLSLRNSKKVFFQNSDDVETFKRHRIISEDKAVLLRGSGVNLERFTVQPLPEQPSFLCISRLIRDKGVYEYLQAARIVKAKYPQVRFLLVGPYDTNPSALKPEELRPFIDEGIVEYFGEQADVRPFLVQCGVYVLPSYREGTPKTVLEAMASGRAVITTDAPGCRETVIDGENGFLVPIKDVRYLAKKVCEFVEKPQLIAEMAAKGRKMTEDIFDVRLINDRICQTMGIENLNKDHIGGAYVTF